MPFVGFIGIGNGWSGRVTTGVAMTCARGGVLAVGGELGGLGANYQVWQANAVLRPALNLAPTTPS